MKGKDEVLEPERRTDAEQAQKLCVHPAHTRHCPMIERERRTRMGEGKTGIMKNMRHNMDTARI
jgi:hypothetical protein